MKVYAVSGLGADERLFDRIELDAPLELIPLPWISPANSQSIADYAARIIDHYKPEPGSVLMGVSFGGMIIQEMAHLMETKALVLISTMTSRKDLPLAMKTAAAARIHPILKKDFLSGLAWLGDKFTSKSKEGRDLFYQMIQDSDPNVLSFGARAILDWKPPGIGVTALRIHGDKDRVFPLKKDWNAKVIKGGNHFMIFDKAQEISGLISEFLNQLKTPEKN